jgi:hypothetical protein
MEKFVACEWKEYCSVSASCGTVVGYRPPVSETILPPVFDLSLISSLSDAECQYCPSSKSLRQMAF